MKILSYAYHGGYEYELAKTGHEFTRVCKDVAKCDFGSRKHPENIDCIDDMPDYRGFDLFFCNSAKIFWQVRDWDIPKVIALQTHLVGSDRKILKKVPPHVPTAFISHTCLLQSGLKAGFVIYHSIDTEEWSGYHGSEPHVLMVANHAAPRKECRLDLFLKIAGGSKWLLAGNNPETPGSVQTSEHEELKEIYRKSRVYLNTVDAPLTMSMLEAMATGAPALSFDYGDASYIIKNGVNGFVSNDIGFLREKLEMLLNDPGLAKSMGEAARETIKKLFPPKSFQDKWNHLFELAVANYKLYNIRGR